MKKQIKIKTKEPIGKAALSNPCSRNCALGISLGKTYFSKENVEAYMRFGLQNFNRMLVWIADYPERWNYIALKGMDKDEATVRALHQGKQVVSKFRKVARKLENEGVSQGRIEVTDSLSLSETNASYENILEEIERERTNNPKFRKDLEKWMWSGIGSRLKQIGLTGSQLEAALETAGNYVKEEMAMMIHLAEKDPRKFVDIYPVSYSSSAMACMRGLNQGKYPELWQRLDLSEGYGFIDARVKRPLNEVVGEFVGNKIGKTPQERRLYRERTTAFAIASSRIAGTGLAAVFALSGPAGFVIADFTTRQKVERKELEKHRYTLVYRTSGCVEVYPSFNSFTVWYDIDGDGKTIEKAVTAYPKFPPIETDSPEELEEISKVYSKLRA